MANFVVTAKECRGNVDKMVRKFIRKTKSEGIIEECRDRRNYKKPSIKKREKRIRAERLRKSDEQKQTRAKERRNRNNK
jgi:ribosomal protein S21